MNIAGYNNYAGYDYGSNRTGKSTDTTRSAQTVNDTSRSFTNVKELSDYISENYNVVKQGMAQISGKYLRECVADEEKRKRLFENLRAADEMDADNRENAKGYQGMKIRIDEDGNMETESYGSMTAFNEGKRARQLAAAKTADNVQMVLGLLQTDLADCEAGVANNSCDEQEVAKVKAMIAKAMQKLAEVQGKSEDEDENDSEAQAFSINLLI